MSRPDDDERDDEDDLADELARKYDPERLLGMVSKRAGKGEALEHGVRSRYEKRFGVDLSHVRVYTGELADELTRKHDAYALTIGGTGMVMMGSSPDRARGSVAGEALLAHELTHVAQAKRGVEGIQRKSSFDGGMPFAQEHEAEAEHVEHAVAQEAGGQKQPSAHEQKQAAEAKRAEQIEQITARVLELATEAAIVQVLRNGPAPRRP